MQSREKDGRDTSSIEVKRRRKNLSVQGRRTCISLEEVLWEQLGDICTAEKLSSSQLCTLIADRLHSGSLTSGIRIFILTYYRIKSGLPVQEKNEFVDWIADGLPAKKTPPAL